MAVKNLLKVIASEEKQSIFFKINKLAIALPLILFAMKLNNILA